MNTATGKLVFLDQSSNMGGFWAFSPDNSYQKYPRNNYILHDGDQLTVFGPEDQTITVWDGTVQLVAVPLTTQGIGGHWVRNYQQDVELVDWYKWFEGGYPASLKTENVIIQYDD